MPVSLKASPIRSALPITEASDSPASPWDAVLIDDVDSHALHDVLISEMRADKAGKLRFGSSVASGSKGASTTCTGLQVSQDRTERAKLF